MLNGLGVASHHTFDAEEDEAAREGEVEICRCRLSHPCRQVLNGHVVLLEDEMFELLCFWRWRRVRNASEEEPVRGSQRDQGMSDGLTRLGRGKDEPVPEVETS